MELLMDHGDHNRLMATYNDNYKRLVALNGKYGPTNFFRVDQNIRATHS
jgi:hypothetical protein